MKFNVKKMASLALWFALGSPLQESNEAQQNKADTVDGDTDKEKAETEALLAKAVSVESVNKAGTQAQVVAQPAPQTASADAIGNVFAAKAAPAPLASEPIVAHIPPTPVPLTVPPSAAPAAAEQNMKEVTPDEPPANTAQANPEEANKEEKTEAKKESKPEQKPAGEDSIASMFQQIESEKVTPLGRLIQSLPDISGAEVLKEMREVAAMLKQRACPPKDDKAQKAEQAQKTVKGNGESTPPQPAGEEKEKEVCLTS